MTAVRMNATGGITRAAAFGAVAVAALALGGCLSFNPMTDPASPAAADVDAVVAAHRQYPRWADFPAGPREPPAPAVIAREVAGLNRQQDALAADVARIDWMLSDPAALAAQIRARLDAAFAAPAPMDTAARIEEMARSLRERAEPPPQVTRPAPRR